MAERHTERGWEIGLELERADRERRLIWILSEAIAYLEQRIDKIDDHNFDPKTKFTFFDTDD